MPAGLPRPPRSGDPVQARLIAQIIAYLRAITPRGGPGVLVSRTAAGTTIAAQGKQRPSAPQASLPAPEAEHQVLVAVKEDVLVGGVKVGERLAWRPGWVRAVEIEEPGEPDE